MNILSKITRKSLLKNKVRTAVTIIGIILSAAMITAVTTSISSFMGYLQDVAASTQGYWHGAFIAMPASDRERLEGDSRVASAAYAHIVGWADFDEGTTARQYDEQYLYVLAGDRAFFERMPITVAQGRLPESPEEIVIWAGSHNCAVFAEGIPQIGDKLTLELGDRYANGETLDRYDPYDDGEELRRRETRTYTVVGYCEEPIFNDPENPGQTVFTVSGPADGEAGLESFFLLKKPGKLLDFIEDFGGGAYPYQVNTTYLNTLGYYGPDTLMKALYGLGAILIGLIMFGSVSLIYNAFSISVSERTKQFGLLRSVGATKPQIRAMVLYEAAAVSAVGVALGIVFGILGMAVTFRFIGGDVANSFLWADAEASRVSFGLHVTPLSVIAAAAVGFVTVLISAWIPSRRAMGVSAIEAIRETQDVAVSPRETKVSPITRRLFGLEGVLAAKNFKRARRRYRATVVSLFMSVVLFISASSFCRYLTDLVRTQLLEYDYDLEYVAALPLTERENDRSELFELMRKADGVTQASASRVTWTYAIVDSEDYVYDGDETAQPQRRVRIVFRGVDDDAYRAFLREHGLDEGTYMGKDAKLILNSWSVTYNEKTGRTERAKILSDDIRSLKTEVMDLDAYFALKEEVPQVESDERYAGCFTLTDLPIGCQVDGAPFGLDSPRRAVVTAYMPMERFESIFGSASEIDFYFAAPDHAATLKTLGEIADGDPDAPSSMFLRDVREGDEVRRSAVTVVNAFAYGFIVLISLIAAANVFNTVSTNILLRRREFAMLRSVGMTKRGFNRMMNYECILYGARSLLLGVPAAFAVTYLIYRVVLKSMDTAFYVPWAAVAIAVGSVFLVVFASMVYSMSSIKRDNTIDALRSEAI